MEQIGLVGLGVMGSNLALNFASRGYRVVGYDRNVERAKRLRVEHPNAKIEPAQSLDDLVTALDPPRCILLMVPAGTAVDDVLDVLGPRLERGDIMVDAGNSHFRDTQRRAEAASPRSWHFVGMGVSGGARGALRGPSLMPGGERDAWPRLRHLLDSIAARTSLGPCVTWCGRGAAGHFVKMVHNGIEYADMQHLSEAMLLLRRGLKLDTEAIAGIYLDWNQAELESFLMKITADIFATPDPEQPESLLLDSIADRAREKGTGRWVVQEAIHLGVAVPSISAAVDARMLSSEFELRHRAAAAGGRSEGVFEGASTDDIRDALFCARIASYSQGFALLAAASREHEFGTDLADVARVWQAGSIIRARLLDDVRRALVRSHDGCIVIDPDTWKGLVARIPGWRRVVSAATRAGIPVPGLAASLEWLDTLTSARTGANLIQAQRDYFGAHGYERIDRPGSTVHTSWQDESERGPR